MKFLEIPLDLLKACSVEIKADLQRIILINKHCLCYYLELVTGRLFLAEQSLKKRFIKEMH